MKRKISANSLIAIILLLTINSCDPVKPPPPVPSANSIVTTLAGSGVEGSADGNATSAQFNKPGAITADLQGNVYVAQPLNFSIRKITSTGVVSTLAGGSEGYADGLASAAQFKLPSGLVTDAQGNIYVADNTRIRKITAAGNVTTLAGAQTSDYADGDGTTARFKWLTGIAMDAQGNIYALDIDVNVAVCHIRKITPAGVVSTFASGVPSVAIAMDGAGNIYTGGLQHEINKYTSAGTLSKLKDLGFPADLQGITLDAQGNIYFTQSCPVACSFNIVYKLTPAGVTSFYAGNGVKGFSDGDASSAKFDSPGSLAIDAHGNIYVSDFSNNRIRKITKP